MKQAFNIFSKKVEILRIGKVSLVAASSIISGRVLKCERIPNYSKLSSLVPHRSQARWFYSDRASLRRKRHQPNLLANLSALWDQAVMLNECAYLFAACHFIETFVA